MIPYNNPVAAVVMFIIAPLLASFLLCAVFAFGFTIWYDSVPTKQKDRTFRIIALILSILFIVFAICMYIVEYCYAF